VVVVQPVVRDGHGPVKDCFELFGVLLFVAPLQVVLGQVESEVGGRFFVDSVVEQLYLVLAVVCKFVGGVVEAEVVGHPLIVAAKAVVGFVFVVFGAEQFTEYLLADFSGLYVLFGLHFE
jgi:hypothetical protein